MELRHLRHFAAVAEAGSLRAAAASLRVAQPALTRTIQDLERTVGAQLFHRLARGVRPTAAGDAFLVDVRQVLGQVGAATARARRVAAGAEGALRILFVDAAGWSGAMPRAVARFRAMQPGVALDLRQAPSVEGIAAVRTGQVDAAFCFLADQTALQRAPAAPDSGMVAVLPQGHPLARRRRLALADLRGVPFILFPRPVAPRFHDALMAHFGAAGLVPEVVQEAAESTTIVALVAAGLGVSVVNAMHRRRPAPGVAFRPISDLSLSLPLELVWRSDAANPALPHFVSAVRAAAA